MPDRDTKTLRVLSCISGIKILRDGEKPCSDIQIMRTGDFEHPWYGDFSITEKDFDDIIKNFTEGDRDVVVDYNHQSLGWDPEAAKAAGWVTKVFVQDGGLFATVEWNDDAVEYIEKDEYRYISPEFEQSARHKETGEKLGTVLYAVALTNRPFLEGMAPVALAEGVEIPEFYRPAKPKPEVRRTSMNEARIRELLSLSEGTEVTDEHRNQALEILDGQVKELEGQAAGIAEAAGVEDASAVTAALKEAPGDGKVITLGERVILTAEQHTALAERAAKADELEKGEEGTVKLTETEATKLREDATAGADASKKLHEKEVADVISQGMKEGRIAASEKEVLTKVGVRDLGELKELVAARPKNLISMKEAGTGNENDNGGGEEVAEFIETEEAKHVAAGDKPHKAYSLALKAAKEKFDAKTMDSYTYAKRVG